MFRRLDKLFEQAGKDSAEFEGLLSRQKKLRANGCACVAIGTVGLIGLGVWMIIQMYRLIEGDPKLPLTTATTILEFSTLIFGILTFLGFSLMFHADQQVKILLLVRHFKRSETPKADAQHGEAG